MLAMSAMPLAAQQPMGSVPAADVQVAGGLEVAASRVKLVSNANLTALDHTAQIDLQRGGNVALCAGSSLHLMRSGTAGSLLFALDQGAMEIHSRAESQDTLLTPDLRFTLLTPGVLDLRIRVTREGDTCVENRGTGAPVVQVAESFSSAQYHLAPGQHVMFEHGSVREIVDNERSNCGCPNPTPVMVASKSANGTSSATPEQAAAMHPFPEAQSQGLAETKPTVPLPANTESAALAYTPAGGTTVSAPAVTAPVTPAATTPAGTQGVSGSAEPPPSPPGAHAILHSIGRFFKRLFGAK